LAPGEEQYAAFAIVGGANLAELEENAEAAQLAYFDGCSDVPEKAAWAPVETRLLPCAPNPFDERTLIRFQLAQPAEVDLGIYDLNGRRVRSLVSGWLSEAQHSMNWDSRDDAGRIVSSGVYFLRLTTGEERQSRRLIRLH
jgi:hypothetical protein